MTGGRYGHYVLLFGIGTTVGALASDSRIQNDTTASLSPSTSSIPTASGSLSPAPDNPFRSVYHYTPTSGNLADLDDLTLHQGEHHLLHQQGGTRAYTASSDMVHWEQLGITLGHDTLGLAMSGSYVDGGANTSGLVSGGGTVAIYTPTEDGEMQSLTYSTDHGRSWKYYNGNPAIPSEGRKDFRNPKIF